MSRRARIVLSNVPHHVTQRGSRRGAIFYNDDDRRLYLQLLKIYSERNGILVLSYCLMENHVHHILVPPVQEALARTLSAVHMRYAQVINGRHAWTGHLWQERFFSSPLDEDYFWTALRYVERNPVKAGLVGHASEYKWSSARARCQISSDPILTEDPKWVNILAERKDWYKWLQDEDDPEKIRFLRQQTRRDLPAGNYKFLEKLGQSLGIRVVSKPRGRPKAK